MQAFLLIIILIAVLLFCLTVHELGHFLFAVLFKVHVREYSIGIGPRLISTRTKKGMRVSLRLLPIAAYVSMDSQELRAAYEEEKPSKKRDEIMAPVPAGKLLIEQLTFWKRQLVNLGGVLVNIICFGIFLLIGHWVLTNEIDYGAYLVRWFTYIGNMLAFQSGEGASIVGAANSLAHVPESSIINYGLVMLSFLTTISLTMAIFNFLPIPPLDGFKILMAFARKIRGKESSTRTKDIVMWVSLVLALYLIAAIVTSDVRSFLN